MNCQKHSDSVLSRVRQQSDSALLFYSCGKDSIVLLDLLSRHFEKVYAIQMYFVKGLEHIEKYFRWSQSRYANVEFISTPHWNLSYVFKFGVYCSPQPEVKQLTFKDIDRKMRELTGCNWSFYGMKQADSMNRRLMLRGYELEAISKTNKVYPLSHWKDADVHSYIRLNNLIKPINYGTKKRSVGITFDLDVFLYLEKHYPGDLQLIFKDFPLSQSILFKHYSDAERKTG